MVTQVTEISTPPTPADPPGVFEQKAAKVWSELHQAVPQMNQQADEIEQIGADAQTAKDRAIQESDAALGYRNETRAARDAALPAAVTATDMAAQAMAAKEHAEVARDDAQAAAQAAVNRVAKTSDTGAALLPEGSDAQRPAMGSIPAGAFVMRGNTQDPADYKPEFWDRVAAGWKVLADRTWVGQQITAAINAVKVWINEQIGFAIVYPNGGTAAGPANIAAAARYVMPNPFPSQHVLCETQILVGGVWGSPGFRTDGATGFKAFALASQYGDEIIVRTGQNGVSSAALSSGTPHASISDDALASAPARVRVWKVKGLQHD